MSDHQPLIDSNPRDKGRDWRSDSILHIRPFFVAGLAFLLIIVAIVLSVFKGCTDLGKWAGGEVYAYNSEDAGFVGKSNQLLAELLTDTVAGVKVTDLASLRRRYPALEFALPYGEEAKPVIEAGDLRLIGIHPERIKTRSLQNFYHNSRLPQLLQQQYEHLGETFFRIRTAKRGVYDYATNTMPIEVTNITINPSMFRVALAKNPWKGTVRAAQNCLFNETNCIFLSFGNSMLPIPIEQRFSHRAADNRYVADVANSYIVGEDGTPIDYYRYYRNACDTTNKERSPQLQLLIKDQDGTGGRSFSIDCKRDSIRITLQGVAAHIYDGQSKTAPVNGEGKYYFRRTDGMKIVIYDTRLRHKYGEFVITDHDPTRDLSRLVQTQTGSTRYNIDEQQTDLFTQQMLRSITRSLSNHTEAHEVNISLDPLLSREFEAEAKRYLRSLQKEVKAPARQTAEMYDISLTVMDMATGDILACPFYTTRFDDGGNAGQALPDELRLTTRNVALTRRYLGSTFKPLVALAASEANPRLLGLQLDGQRRIVSENPYEAEFFGHRVRGWAKESKGHWTAPCSFTDFLSRSDDVYPVALAAIAMTGTSYDGRGGSMPAKGFFETKTAGGQRWLCLRREGTDNLRTNPFTDWMAYITGANLRSEAPDSVLFRHLHLDGEEGADISTYGFDDVCPDPTNLHTEMFASGATNGDFRSTLVPWVLGQGSNEWSAIQIATAWARMLSGHAISPSYIATPKGETAASLFVDNDAIMPACNLGDRSAAQCRQTWGNFLTHFREAQKGGTLGSMHKQVEQLNSSLNLKGAGSLVVFGKTGTPDAYARVDVPIMGGNSRYFDIGLFTFGLMSEGQLEAARKGELPHGVVCVVRITRTYQCKACDKARRRGQKMQCEECRKENGLGSGHARGFFANDMGRLRKFYDMTRRYYRP